MPQIYIVNYANTAIVELSAPQLVVQNKKIRIGTLFCTLNGPDLEGAYLSVATLSFIMPHILRICSSTPPFLLQ
jgi:hypothetical protein